MSNFVKFISHYATEALAIGEALTTILDGVALQPSEAAKITSVIDKLQAASAAIIDSVEGGKVDDAKIVIQKKDIDAAVKSALAPMVEEAVAKALAAKAKTNA